MNYRINGNLLVVLPLTASMAFAEAVLANPQQQAGDSEGSIIFPYHLGGDIKFKGGADADVSSDLGVGGAFTYFASDQLAWRIEASQHSPRYQGTRILDGGQSSESFAHNYRSFSFLGAVEYFFSGTHRVSPYLTARLGLTNLTTKVTSEPPITSCWWDPWWGRICETDYRTYSETALRYGMGVGIKTAVGKRAFFKVSYSQDWLDMNNTTSTPNSGTVTFEISVKLESEYGTLF